MELKPISFAGSKLSCILSANRFLASSVSLALLVAIVSAPSLPALAQANKTQAISLYNLGLSAYKQGSPESAIIFFKRAADIDPDLADAQYNLGVLYQSEKRLKEAVPRFLEVLRLKPADTDAHYQLGLAYIDLQRLPEAREQLAAIAPNSPHFVESQKKIAFIDAGGGASASPQTPVQPQQQPQTPQPPITEAPEAPQTPPAPPPITPAPKTSIVGGSVKLVANGFSAPAGLAFDKLGNLYIANFLSNTIDRISADGIRSQFSSGINIKGPIGLTVDDAGNVYVANYLGGFITRVNPAGISSVIATGFKKPYYLTLDRDGSLFVSQQEDNSVVRISFPKTTAQATKPNALAR
jgi:hypothetical protein